MAKSSKKSRRTKKLNRQEIYEWMLDNASLYLGDNGTDWDWNDTDPEEALMMAAFDEFGLDYDDADEETIDLFAEVLGHVVEGYY